MIPALAAVAIAGWLWFVFDDVKSYRLVRQLTSSRERQRWYRTWLAKAFAFFLVLSLIGLALSGELLAIVTLPAAFGDLAARARDVVGTDEISAPFLIGLGSAFLVGTVLSAFLTARTSRKARTAGNFEALLPRNGRERVWAALLSLNAGVSEELFFRLYLPLLFMLLTGDPLLAFVVSAVMFGLSHLYQGVVGVLVTALFGAIVTAVYLTTGQLWIAIALHVAVDLNSLVLQPFLLSLFRRGAGASRTPTKSTAPVR